MIGALALFVEESAEGDAQSHSNGDSCSHVLDSDTNTGPDSGANGYSCTDEAAWGRFLLMILLLIPHGTTSLSDKFTLRT
jgi:hypothetical protein